MLKLIFHVFFVASISLQFNNNFWKSFYINAQELSGSCEVNLNFTNVGIRNIGPNFIVSPAVRELILQGNDIGSINFKAFSAMPNLVTLDLSYNNLSRKDFFSFESHPNLKKLIFDNNVNSDNQGYVEILNRYESLESLSFRNVKMTGLSQNFSRYVPSLTHMDLSENRIDQKYTFSVLPSTVTHLYLDKMNMPFVVSYGTQLTNLKYLSLNGNPFRSVYGNSLACSQQSLCLNLPNLLGLSIAECQISYFAADAFNNLSNLLSLNLASNLFTGISDAILSKIPKLRELDLSYNLLPRMLNINLFPNLEKLTVDRVKDADMIFNMLKTKWNLQQLQTLSLKGNSIGNVPTEMIANLPALKELNLSENFITSLQFDFRTVLVNIQRIDLSSNAISNIKDLNLNGTQSLELLNIERNTLTIFEINSLITLPKNLKIMYKTVCD